MHDRPGHVDGARDRAGGRAEASRRWLPGAASRAATGPAASELGVGARWPVSSRWAVERCAASSWFIDRTIDSRCACRASNGKCSLIEIPGTLVAMAERSANRPRERRAWGPRCRAGWARPT